MILYHFAALIVPISWGLSSIMAADVVRAYGTLAFNTIRNGFVLAILLVLCFFFGNFATVSYQAFWGLFLSGGIGLFLGDLFLFYGVSKLGPRRATMLFATHVVMTACLAFYLLDENIRIKELFGISLVIAGVILAIAFRRSVGKVHRWEENNFNLWVPVGITILSAFCQAIGVILARIYLDEGVPPLEALTLRVASAFAGLLVVWLLSFRVRRPKPISHRDVVTIISSGILAVLIGNFFLLIALQHLLSGLVATYASMVPIVQMPLLWLWTRQFPHGFAWLGAIMACIGTVFLSQS